MPLAKKRTLLQLNVHTGDITRTDVNVECTLNHYIRAIGILNKGAYQHGIVYLPDDDDEEYQSYIE